MRRLAAGLIAGSLVAGSATLAWAEDLKPSPATAVEAPDGQRVEQPDDGYAISLPLDWDYAVAAEADPSRWWNADLMGDPMVSHERFLADGGVLLARRPTMLLHSCHLFDVTEAAATLADLAEALDALDHCTAPDPGPEVVATAVGYLDLATGRAAFCDIRWADGWHTREYLYTDGRAWFRLGCGTESDPPEDRWLSIGGSFEFLSEE